MKLLLATSCLLVILMATLTRSSVVDTRYDVENSGASERIDWTCTGTGQCIVGCGVPSNPGKCVNDKCCPANCVIGPGEVGLCKPECLVQDCTGDNARACCKSCDDRVNKCTATDCTECSTVESCQCQFGVSPNPNQCGCACDPTKCTGSPVSGQCGTANCPNANGAACKCSPSGCICVPCDDCQCAKDCGTFGGSCNAGTCKCNTSPPASSCPSCQTTLNFDISTCDGTNPCGA